LKMKNFLLKILPSGSKAVFLGLLAAMLVGVGLMYLLVSGKSAGMFAPHPVAPSETFPDIIAIGDGWWETRAQIYHGIPARMVFRVPEGETGSPEDISMRAWREFDRIGNIFNPFDPASEVSRLNTLPASGKILVSRDLFAVLRISQTLWRESSGNFDPTLWQLKQLWRAAEKTQTVPEAGDIAEALKWTGFQQINLMEPPVQAVAFTGHPVKFDFGGIVKGYAVDQVRNLLLTAGISSGLVQLGGEVSAFGDNNGKPWRIGIQHPMEMERIWGVMASQGPIRVSTSGNYRQPIRIGDQSFYHIFSPKTGWPVSEKILGVTTVDLSGTIENACLDGIATAITVMGVQKGLTLAEKSGVGAVILYEESGGGMGKIVSSGLEEYLSED
jgi:thiamine biosynthesis lipoprotein